MSNFSFGTVYQTEGVDTSEFFYNMESGPNVIFTTNFKGLGLPANLYSQFVSLFEYVTADEVECDNTLDGICALPGKCSEFTAYEDFTFKVNFTGTENYIRIPLAAFAEENLVGGGNSICNIFVTYLDAMDAQSTNIIFGGMFFQEFFGVFTNDYANVYDPLQDITLYVGRNAKLNAYIGNEELALGVNPFIPAPTPAPEEKNGVKTVWIVILLLLCAILLAFLGFALYRWKIAQNLAFDKKMEEEDKQKLIVNNSDRPIGIE